MTNLPVPASPKSDPDEITEFDYMMWAIQDFVIEGLDPQVLEDTTDMVSTPKEFCAAIHAVVELNQLVEDYYARTN